MKIVAVSGGFDPIHIGHIRLFKEAKKLGDKLTVILNNDNWLEKKKGRVFMPQEERKEIIEALECVDDVIITAHGKNPEDMSVCRELKEILPDIFANGGDRKKDNVPEVELCKQLGIEMAWNVGGEKIRSSSELIKKYEYKKNSKPFLGILMKKPWGWMLRLVKIKKFWLKLIFVRERTSLQSHKERTEWHIGIYKIPKNERHRLLKGFYIEFAFGDPKEEDIVRYEDDYGRV
jgi:D-beta-D-heptose 7-phosphate kinase/D-beta-D-heptose 1-phosphate adenosyltransferase